MVEKVNQPPSGRTVVFSCLKGDRDMEQEIKISVVQNGKDIESQTLTGNAPYKIYAAMMAYQALTGERYGFTAEDVRDIANILLSMSNAAF